MIKFFSAFLLCLLFVPIVASGQIDLNLSYPTFGNLNINENQNLNQIIAWFYYLIVGISGLAAFIMIVWGGVEWMSSSLDPGKASAAKDRIQSAVFGLLLVLSSFLILQIINPELLILDLQIR
ncbi:MAG: pilin [Candidatus Yanofskybacteria bacterium]|nr:pilin [Candidatus Yanofskybacteria bacterium]